MLRHTLQVFAIAYALIGSAAIAAPAPAQNEQAQQANAPADNAKSEPGQNAAPQTAPGAQAPEPAAPAAGENPNDQKASTEEMPLREVGWPFNGMKGYVDKAAAQRGFQIYSQVCSACHSMDLVTYRDLSKLGFSQGEIKAIASQKQVSDMDDNGAPVQRTGKPFDHFVPPYPNEKASRAANNGAYPPDLSLIVKAREHGPDYVYSILTGFAAAPAGETPVASKYYNPYFEGHWISMPPPLRDGAVTYQDGTTASVDQMARDVVTFLQWAAEPEMEQRHAMGIKVLVFLLIMSGFFYVAKKRVWKKMK